MDDPAQPQLLLRFLFCAVAMVLHTGATAATRRSSRKISVPVGYKFSPTDGDLVNHHLKRKLMNLTEQHCLIPEYNHYEAEPWDLITKYNELSDGESNNDECFFFSTNPSSKRVQRRTPKGRWHETSEKKMIQGSDGVAYVMRYFTFKNGHQRHNRDITAWRMREFTDPSKKELALCKIFKDVDGQKKRKDGPSSVIPEPSTSVSISPGSQTPEAYADMPREARTPTSANLTSNNLASPQWRPTPFDETPPSDPNSMDNGMIAPYQQPPMEERYPPSQNAFIAPHQQCPTDERYQPSQNAFCDQFLNFDNHRLNGQFSDPNLMKDGLISTHHQQPMHSGEGSPLAQADGFSDFIYPCSTPDDEYNKDPLYPHNFTPNYGDVPHSKRPQMVEGTSLEASERPMKKSRILVTNSQNLELPPSKCGYSLQQSQMERERNFSSTNNSPFSSSMSFPQANNMLTGYGSEENSEEVASLFNPPAQPRILGSSNYMGSSQYQFQVSQSDQITSPILDSPTMWQEKDIQDFLASPSNGLSLDEILTTNGTNIEGHSDESRLSPSNYSTYDTSEPTGTQINEAQQPIQQQALSEPFPLPQSPTQPWNSGLPCSNTTAPQQMDMPMISEEWKFPDIDYDDQYSWEVTESYSPLFI